MITTAEMKELEKHAEECGVTKLELMENAGREVAGEIEDYFGDELKKKKAIVICGHGNNGGDGFVVARYLYDCCSTEVLFLGDKEKLSAEAAINYDQLNQIDTKIMKHYSPEIGTTLDLSKYDIIVDAMLGNGIQGELLHPYSTLTAAINDVESFVVSVDIPTGVNPDSTLISEKYVDADIIVTFHDTKKALSKFTNVKIADIGIPF